MPLEDNYNEKYDTVLNILSCGTMVTVVRIPKSQGRYIHYYQMDTDNHLNIVV